jgi:hypothetical protein
VWQHGRCVGLSEETAPEDDYYCELCMPDHAVHVAFRKRLEKKSQAASKKRSLAAAKREADKKVVLAAKRKRALAEEEQETPAKRTRTHIHTTPAPAPSPTPPPADKTLDLLSTPSENLSREERKLKKLMETFQKMEDRQRRKTEADGSTTTATSGTGGGGGRSSEVMDDDDEDEEAEEVVVRKSTVESADSASEVKKVEPKKVTKAEKKKAEEPLSRLRGGVRRDRVEKAPVKRQLRKLGKPVKPKPVSKKDKQLARQIRTRVGPPSEPSRLALLEVTPPAPMYLGKKHFLLKTHSEMLSVREKSTAGVIGFLAHACDTQLSVRKRFAQAFRADPITFAPVVFSSIVDGSDDREIEGSSISSIATIPTPEGSDDAPVTESVAEKTTNIAATHNIPLADSATITTTTTTTTITTATIATTTATTATTTSTSITTDIDDSSNPFTERTSGETTTSATTTTPTTTSTTPTIATTPFISETTTTTSSSTSTTDTNTTPMTVSITSSSTGASDEMSPLLATSKAVNDDEGSHMAIGDDAMRSATPQAVADEEDIKAAVADDALESAAPDSIADDAETEMADEGADVVKTMETDGKELTDDANIIEAVSEEANVGANVVESSKTDLASCLSPSLTESSDVVATTPEHPATLPNVFTISPVASKLLQYAAEDSMLADAEGNKIFDAEDSNEADGEDSKMVDDESKMIDEGVTEASGVGAKAETAVQRAELEAAIDLQSLYS